MPIRMSVVFSNFVDLFDGDLHAVLEAARVADACGIDQIGLPDHLGIGSGTDAYPYGPYPYPMHEPWPEPLTTLAAISAVTSHARLATSVLIAPLRPALLLAKTVATLDVLCGGRLDLGVGIGWQREEFEAAAVPFKGRGDRMLDSLRACRLLWHTAPASFESSTVSFHDVRCLPFPIQGRDLPLWFGGALGQRNAERIAELGAGWMPAASGFSEQVASGIPELHARMAKHGREPAELGVRAGLRLVRDASGAIDLDATLARLDELAERGVTLAALGLQGYVRSPDEVRPFLEKVGRAQQRSPG